MDTVTETSWNILREVRLELGLDKPAQREPDPPERALKTFHKRSKNGSLVACYKPRTQSANLNDEFKPLPGEVVASEWIRKEARRTGYSESTIRLRLYDNFYCDRIVVRRIHGKLSYVREKSSDGFGGKFAEGLI